MESLFTLEKYLEYPIFEEFNNGYRDTLVGLFPSLGRFVIGILSVEDYMKCPLEMLPIDEVYGQPFSSYIIHDCDDVANTQAAIIINMALVQQIGMTEIEQQAAIAHEIGHILFSFNDYKEQYGDQSKEIYCDDIAIKIGLGGPLLTCMNKLEFSGRYSEPERRFGMRKLMLEVSVSDCEEHHTMEAI